MDKIEYKPTGYDSDLTDTQWEAIKEYFPQGPNSEYHKRSLIDAVLYLVDNGCKWRNIPHDFPPYSTVWSFYRRTKINGLWEKVQIETVDKIRLEAGRNEMPSYGLIDSQSTKTIYDSEERGIDGGKKN
jgi:putative transposase